MFHLGRKHIIAASISSVNATMMKPKLIFLDTSKTKLVNDFRSKSVVTVLVEPNLSWCVVAAALSVSVKLWVRL